MIANQTEAIERKLDVVPLQSKCINTKLVMRRPYGQVNKVELTMNMSLLSMMMAECIDTKFPLIRL